MSTHELPESLAWAGEHASEAAVTALADAQPGLVPTAVVAHCETCARCSEAIAAAAMLSVGAGEALAALPEGTLSAARAPLPWRALGAAAVVALVGALPALLETPARLPGAAASLARGAPVLVKGFAQLARASSLSAWVPVATAALLLLAAFALVRTLPAPVKTTKSSRGDLS